jgi:prophage tail gpP-like protein
MTTAAGETATIIINGQKYSFWESVLCERTYGEPVSYCTLTNAEAGPTNAGFANLKIGIGDNAQVYLAEQLAATGMVDMRQVTYGATPHGVQVRIHSFIQDSIASTVKGAPGQHTNSTFSQIANAVANLVGVNVAVLGSPPGADKVFERVSEHVGETKLDFIKRLAMMRDLHMIDDSTGKTLNFGRGGASSSGASFSLVEGQNILSARCIMEYSWAVGDFTVPGQNFGTNEHWGPDAQGVTAKQTNSNYSGPRSVVSPMPMPGDSQDAQMFANHEIALNDLYLFEAEITVPGWTAPDGALWINHMGPPLCRSRSIVR